MMKKTVSMLLISAMAMTMFAGCGSKVSSSVPSSSSAETQKQITLKNWIGNAAETEYSKAQKERFMEEYPNIKFENIVHEGDPGNDYITAVASGTAPDFVYVSQPMMAKYMRFGVCAPLDDYMSKWDESKNLDKKIRDIYSYNGKQYGIPTLAGPMVFAYNKKLFAEAGIAEPPKTWDEVLADAKLLTKPEKQQAGYGMLTQWTEWFFQFYVFQAGGDLTKMNADGTATLTFTDPAVMKAANFYKELRKANVTQKDVTMIFTDLLKNFANGKVAMMGFALDLKTNVVTLGMKPEDLGIIPFPAGPSGVQGVGSVGGGCNIINPKSDKATQDAAFKWLSFLASKDEITKKLMDQKTKNTVDPTIVVRTDIDLAQVTQLDKGLLDTIKTSIQNGKPEFYGKEVFGKYVDKAVQKIIMDPNANPETEFKAAQEAAKNEALDIYNKNMTAK